jgi:hypothetical protein
MGIVAGSPVRPECVPRAGAAARTVGYLQPAASLNAARRRASSLLAGIAATARWHAQEAGARAVLAGREAG